MKKNAFKTHIVSVSITQAIVFILSFVTGILNARLFGPEGIGVLALLYLLQNLGIRMTDFGFGRAFRFYSANGEINYQDLKNIVFILGAIVGLFTIIISLVLKIIPLNIWNDIDMKVYLLFLPSIFFFVLTMYLRHLLYGQLLVKTVNISEVLERISYIALFIVFVWYFDLGLIGFSISISLSTFSLFIQLFIKAQRHYPEYSSEGTTTSKKQNLRKLWGYGQWSYYSAFIEYIFINFPVLLLKSTVGSFSMIGYYNKAKGLSDLPNRAGVPISSLLFSYNAGSTAETAAQRTEILSRFSFLGISLIYFTLAIFIKPLIKFLYGAEFLPAAEVYYYLYPSAVFFVLSIYLSSAIAAKGFNKETFTIRLKSLPFIVIAVYFLITYFGIIGAAIAAGFSFTILWIQYAFKYKEIFGSGFRELLLLKKSDFILIKRIIISIKEKIQRK